MTGRWLPRLLCAAVLGVLPLKLQAQVSLPLPADARQTSSRATDYQSHTLAVGPWADGRLTSITLKGAVEETAWQVPGRGDNTLVFLETLAKGMADQDFQPIFLCETDACGGFDFRYAIGLLPEPGMHVDLGDFRYGAFVRGKGADADYAALTVSRAGDTAFVQLTLIGNAARQAPNAPAPPEPATAEVPKAPAAADASPDLTRDGHMVLEDLSFASGSAELGAGPYPSLSALATYLNNHPDHRIVVVGHTDASGALEANIALSKRRAESVVARLVSDHGADAARLSAEGVGYLSPRDTNLTDAGRQKNRRVEAVLASTR